MKKPICFAVILLAFTAIGSVNQLAVVPYAVLITSIAVIFLIAFNKIDRYIPIYVFALALAMIWQNTMLGTYAVGNDLHREILLAREAFSNGWDPTNYTVYMSNSSVVIGVIAPFLSRILHMDMVWIFKAILPIFLAGVPVVLYYAFSKQFGDKRAFFATMFFISVPVLTMEISTIVKSMVAELFLALMILALVSKLSTYQKTFAISGCLVAMMFSHYTIAIIAVMYLVGIMLVSLVANWSRIREYIGEKRLVVWPVAVCMVLVVGLGYVYYTSVGNGAVIESVKRISGWVGETPASMIVVDTPTTPTEPSEPSEPVEPSQPDEPSQPVQPVESVEPTVLADSSSYLEKQPQMVQAGIGLDFAESTLSGKAFRIVQYSTQGLLLLGAVYLIVNRKKYNFTAEFTAGIIGAFILLSCCIFIPNFSRIINMTRFYHLSLFFLAPLLIVGLEAIFRSRMRHAASVLLGIYLLFTSGFIYEVTQSEVIERVNLPYSSAFSADRTGLVGIYTENDIDAAKWISEQNYKVAGDVNAILLISGYVEAIPRLKPSITCKRYDMEEPEEGTLIFLTEWNIEHNKITKPINVGTRFYEEIPDNLGELVYASGNVRIYLWD